MRDGVIIFVAAVLSTILSGISSEAKTIICALIQPYLSNPPKEAGINSFFMLAPINAFSCIVFVPS